MQCAGIKCKGPDIVTELSFNFCEDVPQADVLIKSASINFKENITTSRDVKDAGHGDVKIIFNVLNTSIDFKVSLILHQITNCY